MFKEYLGQLCGTTKHTGSDLDMVSFWTFCLVVATLLLYMVARNQLSGISSTTKADFVKQFNLDFFVEPTRNLIMLIDFKALIYQEKQVMVNGTEFCYQYFIVDETISNQFIVSDSIRASLRDKPVYTSYEIDDLLLGRFEDIGLFVKRGFLNINDVVNHFSWYISLTWENNEIQKYIKSQRDLYGDKIYNKFEYIYKRCERKNILSMLITSLSKRLGGICE